jgi:putative transcriptional regulator
MSHERVAMTEEEIHAAALADPDAQPLPLPGGDWTGLVKIPNVRKLRERLGLTQDEFAATYRIPVGTLRDWEQRRKNPDATARAYLIVIDNELPLSSFPASRYLCLISKTRDSASAKSAHTEA